MDPNFRRDGPGKSPMGMDLVPVYAGQDDDQSDAVQIDPTVVSNLGVRSATAGFGPLPRVINTTGMVRWDEDSLLHVHTRVEGWIEKLATRAEGERVAAGDLLFELYSPTLVNAQREYLAALQANNRQLVSASRERLAALGVDDAGIARLERERSVSQRIAVRAEADGVIVRLGVREGFYVTPTTEVMSLAQLDEVWFLADVFERQAAWVQAGQSAEIQLEAEPGQRRFAQVDYVYPELDPTTRTLLLRMRLENPQRSLRPHMFGRLSIIAGESEPLVHVPREALIRGARTDRVMLDLGEGRYRVQAVRAGLESGDRVAILEGLQAGDRVVVSGQFLLDSEANIAGALARMDGPGEASVDAHEGMDHSMHEAWITPGTTAWITMHEACTSMDGDRP